VKESIVLGAFLVCVGAVVLICVSLISYENGQESILHSCEHTSFFYLKDKTFECLPYTKGMLDPHPQPNLVPR
jgi:hypothetical protein